MAGSIATNVASIYEVQEFGKLSLHTMQNC